MTASTCESVDPAWLPRTGFIEQAVDAALAKTLSPLAYGLDMHLKLVGHFSTGMPIGRAQNDASTQRQSLRRSRTPCPLLQLFSLADRQRRQRKTRYPMM